jgi:hypothetical protein
MQIIAEFGGDINRNAELSVESVLPTGEKTNGMEF